MDSDQFDTLATRLNAQLDRRRSLGLLGLLGVASIGAPAGVDARKKRCQGKKRKKCKKPKPITCTGCTACEACVIGTCQPLADGATCGAGGECIRGACGIRCTPLTACGPTLDDVCSLEGICIGDITDQDCTADQECPMGQVCVQTPDPVKKCARVVSA